MLDSLLSIDKLLDPEQQSKRRRLKMEDELLARIYPIMGDTVEMEMLARQAEAAETLNEKGYNAEKHQQIVAKRNEVKANIQAETE